MILRQKKNTEAVERRMEENKKYTIKYYIMEIVLILTAAGGMWLLGTVKGHAADRLLANCVMAAFGIAVIGFQLRRTYFRDALDYDNAEHLMRFWGWLTAGLILALGCGFLPVAGWPFMPLFVMLALFSDMGTGILSSSVLLLIAVMLSGGVVGDFALYLISGVFAVALFHRLRSDFKIGIPLFLSVICLVVCETANVVLVTNARPDVEMFVIPGANMIISSILLLGGIKMFSAMVIYKYRGIYLDINDTEAVFLAELREMNKPEYMHCVHTVYFCERIGNRLGLDVDALKCAGYYHRAGDKLENLMEEKKFPPAARKILIEYREHKDAVVRKETAVLLCADTVITSITYLVRKGSDKQIDYGRMIDAVFKKLIDDGNFDCCEISMAELRIMQKLFKEEKLYYDFLR